MYTVSDVLEVGQAEDVILATKVQDFADDVNIPSDLPSEQFDE